MPISRLTSSIPVLALAMVALAAEPDNAERVATPREQALVDRVDAIVDAFSRSADPAVRILFSTNGLDQHTDGTFWLHEVVPTQALVEQARGSTDPLVLDALLHYRCDERAGCDRLDLATRWTVVDAQNQVAWVALAGVKKARGDIDGARAAFVSAAGASTWHSHADDAARRIAAALPRDLSPPERYAALFATTGKGTLLVPLTELITLGGYCRDTPALREGCLKIIDTMARDGSLAELNHASPYAARALADETTVSKYRTKSDAFWWAASAWAEPLVAGAPTEDTPTLHASLDRLDARVRLGERRCLEDTLRERRIDEADAARRHQAAIAAWRKANVVTTGGT
jgi:hypothetical protein